LGTAPRAHYSGPCSYISMCTLNGTVKKTGGRCVTIGWAARGFLFRASQADPIAGSSVPIPHSNGPRPSHSLQRLFPWPSVRPLESGYPSTPRSAPF